MNLKLKALVYMLGILGAGVCGGLLVNTVSTLLGPEKTLTGIFIGVVAFLFYQLYGMILSRLESEQKIKDITDKYIESK